MCSNSTVGARDPEHALAANLVLLVVNFVLLVVCYCRYGLTESLNVSVAASIAIHHSRIARMAALRHDKLLNASDGDLDQTQVQELYAEYESRGRHFGKLAR